MRSETCAVTSRLPVSPGIPLASCYAEPHNHLATIPAPFKHTWRRKQKEPASETIGWSHTVGFSLSPMAMLYANRSLPTSACLNRCRGAEELHEVNGITPTGLKQFGGTGVIGGDLEHLRTTYQSEDLASWHVGVGRAHRPNVARADRNLVVSFWGAGG